ncbi:MAG: glycosyltransferase family 4 protein [Vicinamibacterales bacterium]
MPSGHVPLVSRVLTIAPTPFFGDRGCHVRIYEEVRALGRVGVDSLVVTYPGGNDLSDVRIRRSMALPGVRASALGPSWSRPLLDATLVGTVLRTIRAWKPHVLHAHLHEGAFIGSLARGLTGLPVVADLQGSLTEELIDHNVLRKQGVLTAAARRFERWLVSRPDVLLVSSAAAAGLVADANAPSHRVVALPDGADLDVFRPMPRDAALARSLRLEGRRVVGFLGVLTPYQGVDALLDAVPLVLAGVPDAHFLIMGYPNEDRYRDEARRRGLAEVTTFPGRIPYAEAPTYLALADVAVSPKQSLTEANGKLLNYMACGLATVATDTPVNRELLGSLGRYAPVGNVPALANALIDLLQNPDKRVAAGAALRARVEQEFSWAALARKLSGVYDRVFEATNRGATT